jgi:hypothetical protein
MAGKLLTVKVELPRTLEARAVHALWWDGARTGFAAGFAVALVVGYLLWRKPSP